MRIRQPNKRSWPGHQWAARLPHATVERKFGRLGIPPLYSGSLLPSTSRCLVIRIHCCSGTNAQGVVWRRERDTVLCTCLRMRRKKTKGRQPPCHRRAPANLFGLEFRASRSMCLNHTQAEWYGWIFKKEQFWRLLVTPVFVDFFPVPFCAARDFVLFIFRSICGDVIVPCCGQLVNPPRSCRPPLFR